jgi:hypothetical protein
MPILGAQYIYRKNLGLSPNDITLYLTIIQVPQSLNLFFGVFSDNMPIMGYTRKSYIFIFGTI